MYARKQSFYLVFLFLLLGSVYCSASKDSLILVKQIPVSSHLMSTDHLGNLYIVKGNNILVRYNSNGDSIGVFNEIKKGKITQIDATNPLRILLYFSDYNQIVILDNMLSQKNIIKLNTLGLFNVSAIANSADGGIWAYDAAQGNLLKIDNKPSIKITTPLRNVLDYVPQINYMVEEERVLYTVDSIRGIDQFDLYGFYTTSYRFPCKEVQWFNDQFVYYSHPNFISYHILSLTEKKIALPHPDDIIQVRAERERLFIRRNNQVEIYKY